jgi:hypothetical protein
MCRSEEALARQPTPFYTVFSCAGAASETAALECQRGKKKRFNRTPAILPAQSPPKTGPARKLDVFQSHPCDPAGSIFDTSGWVMFRFDVSIAPLRSCRLNPAVTPRASIWSLLFQSHPCDPAGSIKIGGGFGIIRLFVSIAPLRSCRLNLPLHVSVTGPSKGFNRTPAILPAQSNPKTSGRADDWVFQSHPCDPAGSIHYHLNDFREQASANPKGPAAP